MALGYEAPGQGLEDATVPLESLPVDLPQQEERPEERELRAQTATSQL